jgi:hypothetical protein
MTAGAGAKLRHAITEACLSLTMPMFLPRARFMAEDSIGSEDISISGSSMSDTPPSSRWCGNFNLDSFGSKTLDS